MVLFKVRASGEYGYHYPVKCQGLVIQRRMRADEANMAHSAVARDMFIQRYWFRLLETGSCDCHTVMSTRTWSRCVRSQSA